jgi:hypothetical protein
MIEAVAAGLGYTLRFLLWLIRAACWLAGPCLIVYGIDLIHRPSAFIAAGVVVFAFVLWRSRLGEGRK